MLLGEAALVPVAGALGWWLGAPPFATLQWTRGLTWGVLGTAPLLLALLWCLHTAWAPMVELRASVEREVAPIFASATSVELLLLALLAGVGAEALFRGVLQPVIARHLPLPVAIGVTAAVFGVVHWLTALYALLAAILGVYLGWLAVSSGGVLAPIVAHALYDAVALMLLVRLGGRGRPEPG